MCGGDGFVLEQETHVSPMPVCLKEAQNKTQQAYG